MREKSIRFNLIIVRNVDSIFFFVSRDKTSTGLGILYHAKTCTCQVRYAGDPINISHSIYYEQSQTARTYAAVYYLVALSIVRGIGAKV